MKKNILFIVILLAAQNIFAQTGGRRFFNKSFYVNNVTLLELTDDLGQSLNANNIYKVQLVVTGTGTKTGAEYLVWKDVTTALWQIRAVSLSGNSSNHPLLIVDNNIVKVYTKHTTKYTVFAFVEEIIANEDDVQPSIFGASYHWQRDGTSLSYDGNVGIGTTTPVASLEIKTQSITGSETLLKLAVSDAAQDYIRIVNGTNTDNQFLPTLNGYRVSDNRSIFYLTAATESNLDNGTDPLMVFDSRTSSAAVATRPLFAWDSYNNRKMILTANGSLGIGTLTTGTHKLAVEGSIGAREIKVMATGWSDFVFKKDYDLPTLKEVEKHIKEKGHLENIPSEEEVLKNGINLGEMNSKLLQKIEELTLYAIEQQKNTEKLMKIIEEQNKRLEVLESAK